MQDTANRPAKPQAVAQAKSFNHDKLQAAFCIMTSSVVSIALIIWACKTFF